jgi:hypothetical protein
VLLEYDLSVEFYTKAFKIHTVKMCEGYRRVFEKQQTMLIIQVNSFQGIISLEQDKRRMKELPQAIACNHKKVESSKTRVKKVVVATLSGTGRLYSDTIEWALYKEKNKPFARARCGQPWARKNKNSTRKLAFIAPRWKNIINSPAPT